MKEITELENVLLQWESEIRQTSLKIDSLLAAAKIIEPDKRLNIHILQYQMRSLIYQRCSIDLKAAQFEISKNKNTAK